MEPAKQRVVVRRIRRDPVGERADDDPGGETDDCGTDVHACYDSPMEDGFLPMPHYPMSACLTRGDDRPSIWG